MIEYRKLKGYKYQLMRQYSITIPIKPLSKIKAPFIRLGKTGRLQILKGYSWDGCSGPTWDDKTNMRAGLVHDAIYQVLRNDWLQFIDTPTWEKNENRLIADKLLRQICLEDGMGKIRAWYYYKAVRLVGGAHLKTGLGKGV